MDLELPVALVWAWPWLAGGFTLLAAAAASGHAVLHKRAPRSAALWVGLIWLAPAVGPVLYVVFGLNRIRRRGQRLPLDRRATSTGEIPASAAPAGPVLPGLRRLVDRVTGMPLTVGNRIEPLLDGDATYPAMWEAIAGAKRSIALQTYIFDNGVAGRRFVDELAAAVARGVEVRVLVDAVGARYSWPRPISSQLRRRGVRCAEFLRTAMPWRFPYANLRNHRKVMVVDGEVGFCGGLNIRDDHVLAGGTRHPTRDVHFRLEGPVVAQLLATFFDDWRFAAREELSGPAWQAAEGAGPGSAQARAIHDGPDEDLDTLRWALLGATHAATERLRVVTPYFLPEDALHMALAAAALRGVTVDLVLPEHSNLSLVTWASNPYLPMLLDHGCRVFFTPAPFDHAKLLTVDGHYTLFGSANWDPRSLRLNFELCVEAWDAELCRQVDALIDERVARGRALVAGEIRGRPLPARLRDGFARLASPYL